MEKEYNTLSGWCLSAALWYAFFISTAEEEGSIPLKEEKEVYWSNNCMNM
jgi:hypothetical protein